MSQILKQEWRFSTRNNDENHLWSLFHTIDIVDYIVNIPLEFSRGNVLPKQRLGYTTIFGTLSYIIIKPDQGKSIVVNIGCTRVRSLNTLYTRIVKKKMSSTTILSDRIFYFKSWGSISENTYLNFTIHKINNTSLNISPIYYCTQVVSQWMFWLFFVSIIHPLLISSSSSQPFTFNYFLSLSYNRIRVTYS